MIGAFRQSSFSMCRSSTVSVVSVLFSTCKQERKTVSTIVIVIVLLLNVSHYRKCVCVVVSSDVFEMMLQCLSGSYFVDY